MDSEIAAFRREILDGRRLATKLVEQGRQFRDSEAASAIVKTAEIALVKFAEIETKLDIVETEYLDAVLAIMPPEGHG